MDEPISPRSRSYVDLKSPHKIMQIEVLESSEFDEDDGIPGFLQFCPTCERQISDSKALYCSEACQRRDSAYSSSPQHRSPSLSPYLSPGDRRPSEYEYKPRYSPTVIRPVSTTFSLLSLYELNPKDSSDEDAPYSTFGMPIKSPRTYVDRKYSDELTHMPSLSHTPSSSHGTAASHLEAVMARAQTAAPRRDSKSRSSRSTSHAH